MSTWSHPPLDEVELELLDEEELDEELELLLELDEEPPVPPLPLELVPVVGAPPEDEVAVEPPAAPASVSNENDG